MLIVQNDLRFEMQLRKNGEGEELSDTFKAFKLHETIRMDVDLILCAFMLCYDAHTDNEP